MAIRLFTVESNSPIIGLGNIQGPLTTPTKMEFGNVLKMIKSGYVIYEHNPADTTEKVRVTINNINNIKFEKSRFDAVTRRTTNEEIQSMNNAMNVAVLKKEDKKEKPEPLKAQENNKNNNKNDKSNKVIKSDDFTS